MAALTCLPLLHTIQITQTQAKRTRAPTLAIESAPLVYAETATLSVAPSEGQTSVRRPPHPHRNSTSSIESVDLRGHGVSPPPPHASPVGAYSEQEALAIETQSTESRSTGKSTHTAHSDLYTRLNERLYIGMLQPIQDVCHTARSWPCPKLEAQCHRIDWLQVFQFA